MMISIQDLIHLMDENLAKCRDLVHTYAGKTQRAFWKQDNTAEINGKPMLLFLGARLGKLCV